MKRIVLFLSVITIGLLSAHDTFAQSGWQWARKSAAAGNGMFDVYQSVCDRAGNTIFDGIFEGDTMTLGTTVVHNTGFSHVYQEIVIVKVDQAGNYKWAIGTTGPDYSNTYSSKIVTDADGNVYVAISFDGSNCTLGSFTLTNPNSPASNATFLAKISPDGAVLWAKSLGSASIGGLGVDSTEEVYLAGSFTTATFTVDGVTLTNKDATGKSIDIYAMRLSPAGTAKWGKSFGSKANDDVVDMGVSRSGNVYIFARNYLDSAIAISSTVTIDSTYYMVKYDHNGTLVLAKEYARNGLLPTVITISPSESIYAAGYEDMYNIAMIKYASDGTILYGQVTPSTDATGKLPYSIALDLCGNLWTCGSMATSNYTISSPHGITFPGYTLNSPAGSLDPMYIARYDTMGNYISSMALASGGEDWNDISLDNKGNFIVAGDYMRNYKVGFGSDTLYTATMQEDLFIAKYHYDNIDCDPYVGIGHIAAVANDVTIFPNPATNECTISIAGNPGSSARAELYDMTGRLVRSIELPASKTIMSLDHLAPGIYQCRVTMGDDKITVKRLVVMQ